MRIEEIQAGTRKRRRGAGPATNTEGRTDAAEGTQVYGTITAATSGPSGKRKRPRAAQEAS
jgi:hypothetical protein